MYDKIHFDWYSVYSSFFFSIPIITSKINDKITPLKEAFKQNLDFIHTICDNTRFSSYSRNFFSSIIFSLSAFFPHIKTKHRTHIIFVVILTPLLLLILWLQGKNGINLTIWKKRECEKKFVYIVDSDYGIPILYERTYKFIQPIKIGYVDKTTRNLQHMDGIQL